MGFRLIFNHAFKMAQYLLMETATASRYTSTATHKFWPTHWWWELVVTPPWRAPCEWMEVWLICSASESHGLAGLQPSARLFISFSHSQHSLTHTLVRAHKHTYPFGVNSPKRTISFDSHNVINLKQTTIQKHHMMATKQNMLIDISKSISFWRFVQCNLIKVHWGDSQRCTENRLNSAS